MAVGERVYRLAASVGGVRPEATGSERAEPSPDPGGPGGQLGSWHTQDQHTVPEGPAHAGLRQGMEGAHRVQGIPGNGMQIYSGCVKVSNI